MGKHQVRFEQYFAAPRAEVFAYFSDHAQFGKVMGSRMRRIKDGKDAKDLNGLGSVREIRAGFFKFEETITKYQKSSVIEYQVTRGSPIKNHLGRLIFTDDHGGTMLVYTIQFDPRIPFTGRLIAGILCASWNRGVHRAIADLSHRSAQVA